MDNGFRLINHASPTVDKIALFRSLFRGREDVYPRRFQSQKTQKSGYAPACRNEWVINVCAKPKIKCHDCMNRQFIPITDDIIYDHLMGIDKKGKDFVMGIYPMLLDESCFFLAVDFDKANWAVDAVAFLKTCQLMNVPAALERSRSGKGAHVWLFFKEAIPAILARKLGSHILTETMDRHPELGFDSYDRFFPNQDTLPRGGCGNLIALPLQKKPRENGSSVFIDESLQPYADQWEYLAAIEKISRTDVEAILEAAEIKGRILGVRFDIPDEENPTPWNSPPSHRDRSPILGELPKQINLVIGSEIFIEKEALPAALQNRLIRLAAFQNPEFYKNQAMRLPTYDTPRIIGCARDHSHHIGLPRGCLDDIIELLRALKIEYTLQDELNDGARIAVAFRGELRPAQAEVVDVMMKSEIGVLSATTAFGKTVVAAWLIAKRQVNTLILVHTKQLQDQWVERLQTFLELPKKSIGRLGGGRKKVTGFIDVVLIQSLIRKDSLQTFMNQYGHIVVDECHHIPSQSFENVILQAKARFVTGLSATVVRKDGHHPIITMRCGPIRYRVNAKEQALIRPFTHRVIVRPTAYRPTKFGDANSRVQFQDLYEELIQDAKRNQMICEDIVRAVDIGRSPLVLTERNEHLDKLYELLLPKVPHLLVLRGGMRSKELSQTVHLLKTIPPEESRVLLATGRFVGEGFDDPRLDTLFLTLPISWKGTIAQYVGRLHRQHDFKKEVQVYDYADLAVPMLERMFNRRWRAYEAVGYTIILPASAEPGWPMDVVLPAEPAWKVEYVNTVQRLVRDGLDTTLAQLFSDVATQISDKNGVERARSAVEAFLFCRLETLPETTGHFHLNHVLPIPFDGSGHMEVDLLCADALIAIEIDGLQHLSSPEAYRRDRRKDILLQENGYLVLRFLAEDVTKHLDNVLDLILRAIVSKKSFGLRVL